MGILYFRDGQLIAEQGDARVYEMDGLKYLEVGENNSHTMWTDESEKSWYYKNGLDFKARGFCLELGLGMGWASEIILSNSEVEQLITVEINLDVIAIQDEVNPISDDRHVIINDDADNYTETTNNTFDFVFIDTYLTVDEDTLLWLEAIIPKIRTKLNSGGEIMAWLDEFALEEDKKRFYEILSS